jgi:hypothetical protein
MLGYILDSGILISIAKHPQSSLREQLDVLQQRGVRLVTINDVFAECRDVPLTTVQELNVLVERTERPQGSPEQLRLLDSFQAGTGDLTRADRSLVGHAIARHMDILTTDASMKERSFREFLSRLNRVPDAKLPHWYLPNIEVVRGHLDS